MTDFEKKVLALANKIPSGKVTTYKLLAKKLGRSKASRAVANALRKNPSLIKIPCHRVIKSDGQVGGYQLGEAKKLKILMAEGIELGKNHKIKNLKKFLFTYD